MLKSLPQQERNLGRSLAKLGQARKAILGVFDEGCMGMYNAIIEDNLLTPLGVYKERLSHAALVAAMRDVSDSEAQKIRDWLDARGLTLVTGPKEEPYLTDRQILEQCKIYVEGGQVHVDLGRATAVELPAEETERRWQAITRQ